MASPPAGRVGAGCPEISESLTGAAGRMRPVPAVGLGTASFPFVEEDVRAAVLAALELGYRHLDTASLYRSERAVGEAVAEAARLGVVASRGEVFVTTKVWCSQCHPDLVLPSLRRACSKGLLSLKFASFAQGELAVRVSFFLQGAE
ncbi:putative oxidoreductase, aldo/keto reductase family protein [Panicum miliaceum]|uniref:Oxidoreductase, aldo/keto reductase family protein n=1 Tax=Panicum miliaceum TaxID=4540 RepID=A0A3L6QAS4_PANMI|nr:putative oxidoreductase, aldo/keto reductase family protein [Panicum miliaceum]